MWHKTEEEFCVFCESRISLMVKVDNTKYGDDDMRSFEAHPQRILHYVREIILKEELDCEIWYRYTRNHWSQSF